MLVGGGVMAVPPFGCIVIAVTSAFCVEPVVPEGAVLNTIAPPAPVPVPFDPAIVRLTPAVLDVPATTDCCWSVDAIGDALSLGPTPTIGFCPPTRYNWSEVLLIRA